MKRLELLKALSRSADTRILLYVIDGVGGLPHPETGRTELETARLPNLDAFCKRSATGRSLPIGAGIAPGSGPAHMALFGYPATDIALGRGVLEVLGATRVYQDGDLLSADFELGAGDLSARGNFAIVEPGSQVVRDRRGGKPDDARNEALVQSLSERIRIDGVELFLFPGKGHRFAVCFRGEGLTGPLHDTDPQQEGLPVVSLASLSAQHSVSVRVVESFLRQAHEVLAAETQNFALLRGLGLPPQLPSWSELYGVRAAALAVYPMYRGVARLVGMDIIPVATRDAQVEQLAANRDAYDIFFVHIKEPDAIGHLGDFDAKVAELERVDAHFARCLEVGFDVVIVTGDHCTPSVLKDHTGHPVPTAIASKNCLVDEVEAYHERAVIHGSLGTLPARDLLPYALGEAGRLKKYGA
jgi:2,3-bisphosphoglycerate-independent phosphoglycerate mutase